MRLWINTLLRLIAGTYFLLTSLYCLLAFLPYTYCAFIKAPPYPWMPWLTHHQAALYWLAAAAIVVANWDSSASLFVRGERIWPLAGICVLFASGVYLSAWPFLPSLQSNRAAYWWSMVALLPVVGLALWRSHATVEDQRASHLENSGTQVFGYSAGLFVAFVVSAIYTIGARMRIYSEGHGSGFHAQDAEFAVWSLISHFVLAIVVLSALNVIFLIAAKSAKPIFARRLLTGALIVAALSFVLARFLDNAMSFDGWGAYAYAATLALALTLWGFSLVLPFLQQSGVSEGIAKLQTRLSWRQSVITWITVALLTVLALASRWLIGGEDWNGFAASTWALAFWIAMSLCVYRLRPARAHYSAVVVVGILLTSAFVYKGLQATEIFWAKPLGSTDDEISLKFEEYGNQDASFQLAHHVLGNNRNQACGDLCRILREYTNIRDTHITAGVRLVDHLAPAQGERPNVFIFVIDSMRPDYLGAYNPQHVHYTPNLDALARDSVVFKNVYTQYAGTSLSEPAIWSGALLLHTHFPQPFDEVNSLRTLARTDGYQLVASYDTVLRQLFSPSDELTKLDSDKELWNQYEACSTVAQLESTMDERRDKSQPVFFYAQPMNVHQFARNDVPSPTSQHWQSPERMNGRITYEVHWVDSCLGGFLGYLKQRGLYDNSIIVIASDHGDATGEFGRTSHSTSIWPEIMRVPLIVHVPPKMRERMVFDENRLSTLTDIAPTLYYLLGHRPIRQNPLYGHPLFAETRQELDAYKRDDLLLASDVRAVYGILTADGRYLYTTYDSPAESYLFDLNADPNAEHNMLTAPLKQCYDEEIIGQLHVIGDYYGYKPGVGSLLAAARQ
ncbi:MAG TPA: sulfatase-like hydrolase/transferase [Candidatus Sulfotelmatobacter sp.]|nr:sulfatase-like hydrolase/transferase [Candidatus Sulfotelmatobacter sp.]